MSTLDRFVEAQAEGVYEAVLSELRAGRKRSHWMWFVFPQIAGLGSSATARAYAIRDLHEAADYAAHPVLAPRLRLCVGAMLDWAGRLSADAILGPVDTLKFRSSLTLFERAAPDPAPFAAALESFYAGQRDEATLARL